MDRHSVGEYVTEPPARVRPDLRPPEEPPPPDPPPPYEPLLRYDETGGEYEEYERE